MSIFSLLFPLEDLKAAPDNNVSLGSMEQNFIQAHKNVLSFLPQPKKKTAQKILNVCNSVEPWDGGVITSHPWTSFGPSIVKEK